MSRLSHTSGNGPGASEHAARYEALRHHAMQRHGLVARHGLAVLLRQGVAAWMDAWSKLPAVAVQTVKDDTAGLLPWSDSSCAEVVRVLAAMTLEHIQQVSV